MNTQEAKRRVRKSAERVDDAVKTTAAGVGNGVEALAGQGDALLGRVRELGHEMREGARTLSDAARKQARLRPLAVFGVAFVAGVIAARALRRRA